MLHTLVPQRIQYSKQHQIVQSYDNSLTIRNKFKELLQTSKFQH